MSFVHLHLHTEYSLLEGYTRMDRLFSKLKEYNMSQVAITDYKAMYGAPDFYKQAKANGIKAIIGAEVFIGPTNASSVVLLAKNSIGYQNLIKIVSNGFYNQNGSQPIVEREFLISHADGLICILGGHRSLLHKTLADGNEDLALSEFSIYSSVFSKDDLYIEITDYGTLAQKRLNIAIIKFKNKFGLNLVATNNVHFLEKDDYKYYKMLVAIGDERNYEESLADEEAYLKSAEQMHELFAHIPEAISNTVKIADKCNFEFDFKTRHFPKYPCDGDMTAEELFHSICSKGFVNRYLNELTSGDLKLKQELEARLKMEMDIITKMGYIDYFLIVWDFVKFAHDNKIRVGAARGSGGGSMVAYCMHITDVDPIRFKLIFERFLNPERVSMPDFDIDFQDDRRQEVIDYVIQKYTHSNVANIATFGTFKAKQAIRDIGRVMKLPLKLVDRVAKLVPTTLNITIERALREVKQLKELYDSDGVVHALIDNALALEGLPRHVSTHAAGIVITSKPIVEYVPIYKSGELISTQYNMTLLEELGLLKMDFLGLITLNVIESCVSDIASQKGADFNIDSKDYSDKKVFEMISKGDTNGVFQLESSGMKDFMKRLKPSSLEDIIAGIALYRPGPMDSIPKYIQNKHNPEMITYLHEKLKPILSITYGCIVYQEQVLEIVRSLAGYSYGRADEIRRAMSKKKEDVMIREQEIFINGLVDDTGHVVIEGCVRNGVSANIAMMIFAEILDFAKYAFNKAHAAGYAIIAYQTAYLKANYPLYFFASLLSNNMNSPEKLKSYIEECSKINIEILPPDISKSYKNFVVEGDSIRFGLYAIKNLGITTIENIIQVRKKKVEFKDFKDFLNSLEQRELNKKSIEALIKSGSLDLFKLNRNTMLCNYDTIIDKMHSHRISPNQITLFDGFDDLEDTDDDFLIHKELPKDKVNEFEREVLGFVLSDVVKQKEKRLYIRVSSLSESDFEYIKTIANAYKGNVKLVIYDESQKRPIMYNSGISLHDDLMRIFKKKFGIDNVVIN